MKYILLFCSLFSALSHAYEDPYDPDENGYDPYLRKCSVEVVHQILDAEPTVPRSVMYRSDDFLFSTKRPAEEIEIGLFSTEGRIAKIKVLIDTKFDPQEDLTMSSVIIRFDDNGERNLSLFFAVETPLARAQMSYAFSKNEDSVFAVSKLQCEIFFRP